MVYIQIYQDIHTSYMSIMERYNILIAMYNYCIVSCTVGLNTGEVAIVTTNQTCSC